MNRKFKYYAIVWAIFLVVFNAVCFVTPGEIAGMSKFNGAFWAGYIFITLAFAGQLVCAYIALHTNNKTQLFYNIPIIRVSYTGLILTIVFGTLCMAVPNLPNWVGVIGCLIILVFTAVAVVKAKAVSGVVKDIDDKKKQQMQFIRMTTVTAQNIMNNAQNDVIKSECKKVYEALLYSDPMSSDALSGEETKIASKMDELAKAVSSEADSVSQITEELLLLVKERNNKCKALK